MVKDSTMKCWHCGAEQEKPASGGRLSFRALCCRCDAWLHCCKNCQNYKPGLPNDCMVPGTDPIADREAFNFCEEFALKGTGTVQTKSAADAARRLFGDEDTPEPKKGQDRFRSLFDD